VNCKVDWPPVHQGTVIQKTRHCTMQTCHCCRCCPTTQPVGSSSTRRQCVEQDNLQLQQFPHHYHHTPRQAIVAPCITAILSLTAKPNKPWLPPANGLRSMRHTACGSNTAPSPGRCACTLTLTHKPRQCHPSQPRMSHQYPPCTPHPQPPLLTPPGSSCSRCHRQTPQPAVQQGPAAPHQHQHSRTHPHTPPHTRSTPQHSWHC
jgi:hypothetical protein